MGILNTWEDWEYEVSVGRVEVEGAEDRDPTELSDVEREELEEAEWFLCKVYPEFEDDRF